MENNYLYISFVLFITYLFMKLFYMYFIDKQMKSAKEIAKDSILMGVSTYIGLCLLNEVFPHLFHPIQSATPTVFTDIPDI